LPELARGEGVTRGVGSHPALAGKVTRIRLEAVVAPALDHGQNSRAAGDRNACDPVRSKWIALSYQAEIMRPRECRDALDLDRDLGHRGASPPDEYQPRENGPWVHVGGRRHCVGLILRHEAECLEPARQSRLVADDEMIDPVDEACIRLLP